MPKAKTLYSSESHKLTSWLKAERKRSGLSIRGLAVKLGWASSIVGKIEQGERRLDLIEFVHYCEALGANPHDELSQLVLLEKKPIPDFVRTRCVPSL